MASLFPDEQMHLGGDETGTAPPCTLANTKQFEVAMIQKILSLGKQPAGWEELLFTTQAAVGYPSVVVHSWHHTHWEQVVDLGHRAVFSNLEPFYLDAGGSQVRYCNPNPNPNPNPLLQP